MNTALEYEVEGEKDQDSCFALSVQPWRKQAKDSNLNQSKTHMRKEGEKAVSFSELAVIGNTPLTSKMADRKVKEFNLAIRNLL